MLTPILAKLLPEGELSTMNRKRLCRCCEMQARQIRRATSTLTVEKSFISVPTLASIPILTAVWTLTLIATVTMISELVPDRRVKYGQLDQNDTREAGFGNKLLALIELGRTSAKANIRIIKYTLISCFYMFLVLGGTCYRLLLV